MVASETSFAQRLDLVLRALTISRGRFASESGVDKSLVSRWLNGSVRPSSHNLERLTRVVSGHRPGFSMLDWDKDMDELGRVLGVVNGRSLSPPTEPVSSSGRAEPLWSPGRLPFGSLEGAALETERRAAAYTGRWKITRLASTGAMTALVEHVLIRPDGSGLCVEHYFKTHSVRGWLIVSHGILYAFVADSDDDSFGYYCLNGAVGSKATVLDGIITSVGGSRRLTPFSQIVVLEREGDLEGDKADAAWAESGMKKWGPVDITNLKPKIVAAISRDFGAGEAARGGEAILRVPYERSLANGSY